MGAEKNCRVSYLTKHFPKNKQKEISNKYVLLKTMQKLKANFQDTINIKLVKNYSCIAPLLSLIAAHFRSNLAAPSKAASPSFFCTASPLLVCTVLASPSAFRCCYHSENGGNSSSSSSSSSISCWLPPLHTSDRCGGAVGWRWSSAQEGGTVQYIE